MHTLRRRVALAHKIGYKRFIVIRFHVLLVMLSSGVAACSSNFNNGLASTLTFGLPEQPAIGVGEHAKVWITREKDSTDVCLPTKGGAGPCIGTGNSNRKPIDSVLDIHCDNDICAIGTKFILDGAASVIVRGMAAGSTVLHARVHLEDGTELEDSIPLRFAVPERIEMFCQLRSEADPPRCQPNQTYMIGSQVRWRGGAAAGNGSFQESAVYIERYQATVDNDAVELSAASPLVYIMDLLGALGTPILHRRYVTSLAKRTFLRPTHTGDGSCANSR